MSVTDEARRHPPHHRDHRRRPAQRRLLRARAGAAAGQEVRQPGRPDRLPPLLRRRERLRGRGPDVLRVPERAAGPRGRGDDPPDRAPRRLARTTLEFWDDRLGSEGVDARGRRRAALRGPRRARARAASSSTCRTRRCPRARPRCRTSTRCRASTRSTRRSPTRASARAADRRARLRAGGEGEFEDPRRPSAAARSTSSRRRGRGFGGAGTIHHIAWARRPTSTTPGATVLEAGMRATPGDRPLLLQIGLLPRARRHPL